MIDILQSYGADALVPSSDGCLPVTLAAFMGREAVFRHLLSLAPRFTIKQDKTTMNVSVVDVPNSRGFTAVHAVAGRVFVWWLVPIVFFVIFAFPALKPANIALLQLALEHSEHWTLGFHDVQANDFLTTRIFRAFLHSIVRCRCLLLPWLNPRKRAGLLSPMLILRSLFLYV
jgi:hypothetical protein